ncbi:MULTISPECIES: DHA2 family efflux MFS transporter permease subunit [Pelosinus]|jgi:EmrB/QacA subfamily drug resistance transporter|uniref:Drug resistance transporter, EmrB/QacA subfamily n=1 Tax=Pelosinus fermentans B4 TaxID=1149862 RepID=I8RDW5_9FIRM|nr:MULTISPECIES: DHA2 family efflux MFS transporter permease subunit [Pelosinus]MDF2571933.1 EmrB/QacA subfamily drug resistance transporter [Sporomusa sp.]EIW15670.1 drug resistance transporter, EmrB/QacA subfamily [Pelosinus fermentans B4]EIW26640.1 drug resistance transporter, EmrB/QacA subfamily [Pelosinus fermentans A11]OAM92415.1 drug resistance transporter, EmrB/QacA subfamily [Pelosinus fermentans DSM 17108]SDQ44126.1 drug resistance transporter, EmrB/QacA subfamily [Pelosinus fermenta
MDQSNQQVEKGILLFILILGAFLSLLNQTILNVALPDLMKQFEVSTTTIQWLSTGFMLVNGIIIPATAFFIKRFTTRQLFVSSMVLLLVGTFINATAPNFAFLLTGRLIQAAGAGIIMPLLMVVILAVFPEEGRGAAMGIIGLVMIVAPAIAPTLAGFVIGHFSWRWLFIGMFPLVVIVIALSLRYLVNVSETSKPKLDIISILLSTAGFGGILFGFSSAADKGWGSVVVLGCLILGTICLVLFVWRQLMSSDPLLNLQVFKNRMFTITTIILVLSTMVMYADIILLPIYLQESRGYTVLETGLLLLPGALLSALMSPISGRLFDKIGAKPLVVVGLLFSITAIGGFTNLSETTSYHYLMTNTIILRIGMSLITMPVNTGGLNALPKHLTADGTAVSNTVRQVAGSVGTALPVTIMTMRTQSHAAELLQSGDILSQSQIIRQASILGISDAYIFTAVIVITAFLVTIFMPNQKE